MIALTRDGSDALFSFCSTSNLVRSNGSRKIKLVLCDLFVDSV
jgi:hypothetical protein